MANILVPTDFTPASLKWAEQVIKKTGETNAGILLFHAFSLPANLFDLLGSPFREPSLDLLNEPFRQACKQLKDLYPKQVSKIYTRCMNGSTRALFRNFAEANDVDLIYFPGDYIFSAVHQRSVNPLPLTRNCGIPFIKEQDGRKEAGFSNQRLQTLSWFQPSGTT